MKKTNWAILPLAVLILVCAAVRVRHVLGTVTLPAFAGAQGGGAESLGGSGRNGSGTPVVFEVTNLNDTGTGSLRACLEASGPRTCIFRVAGRITFKSRVNISNPYITIAGQTAPGQIVIGGIGQVDVQMFVETHDVTVRYLTYDGYDALSNGTGPNTGTVCCEMGSGDIYNVIWDHMTARWVGNKPFPVVSNVSGKGIHNMDIQWSLIYEPNVAHAVGIGTVFVSSGSGLATTDDDAHHNAFITVDHRLPLNQSGRNVRWVNNLIYNWGQFAALSMGGVQTDYIGNKYVDGSGCLTSSGCLNYSNAHVFLGQPTSDQAGDSPGDYPGGNNLGNPTFYMLNNTGRTGATRGSSMVAPTNVVNDAGEQSMMWQGHEAGDLGSGMPGGWLRGSPLAAETFPITADPVTNLDNVLLPTVGNSLRLDCDGNWQPTRDSEDQRIINIYKNNLPDDLFYGQRSAPAIASVPPCTETQHDGIPDQWKVAKGYSTTDANLWKSLASDGYTILEHYLNGSGAITPPPPVTPPSPPPTPGPSSANLLNLVTDVKNRLLPLNTAIATITRVCMLPVDQDNAASPIVDGDLGPQGRLCFVPYNATVIEITVAADAGTPNVIVARNHAGTLANLTSSALATGSAGALACSNTGGTAGLDGVTTCSGTLQNTSLSKGDWLELRSGTAGGTAKRMSIAVTYTIN
jgi:pectate lyase